MITKYIKVPAIILGPEDEEEGQDEVIFTREKLRRHFAFEESINEHLLLKQHVIDIQAYLGKSLDPSTNYTKLFPKGTVRAANWVDWLSRKLDKDKFPFDKIKSIVPACVNIEDENDPGDYGEPKRWERKLKNYLYIRIDYEDELTEKDIQQLYKYMSGQLSDGWGENASAESFVVNVTDREDEDKWEPKSYHVYYQDQSRYFKMVDNIGPRAYL